MCPEVVADEPWPYGLVGDEKSYARQLDGDFFADVKNSDHFLQALKEEAEEKQVDADAHLKSVRLNAKNFMKGSTIVDRSEFIDALLNAVSEDGLLTLVLGGKSVGKTLVVSRVADKVRQTRGANRTTLLLNMRQMPAKDFYEATLSVASESSEQAQALWEIIKQLPIMATAVEAAQAGFAGAAAPLAVQNLVKSLDDDYKAEALSELVKGIAKKCNDTTIIIDEANLVLPNNEDTDEAKTAKRALAQITGSTKEALQASVILISSEHCHPFIKS